MEKIKKMNNSTYWAYNVPVQISPNFEISEEDNDSYVLDENGNKKITGFNVVNYMPRKATCCDCDLDELLEGQQSREEFLEYAAQHLENLARLLRESIHNPEMTVYYADHGFVLDEQKLAKNLRKPD